MPKLELIGLKRSVYTRIVRLVLTEKNVDYDLTEVDIFEEDGPTSQYLELHPFGRIPCIVHGDFVLYETTAISRYIDDYFDGIALQPTGVRERARMGQIISVLDSYVYRPMVWNVFVQRVVIPEEGGNPREEVICEALPRINTFLRQLNVWLGRNDFLTGESATLADLHGFPMFFCFVRTPEGEEAIQAYPNIGSWYKRIANRESAEDVMSV